MRKIIDSIVMSARGFGRIETIAACGMLLALKIVLGMFTVNVSSLLKIGFSFLPIAAAGMLFGPVAGGAVGAAGDVASYFLQPTGPFFPGFTFDAFLSGFVYGLFLYRRPVRLPRVFSAKAAITVLISFLMNPLWLSVLYGKSFTAVVAARAAANFAILPVETAMLFALLKILKKSRVLKPKRDC